MWGNLVLPFSFFFLFMASPCWVHFPSSFPLLPFFCQWLSDTHLVFSRHFYPFFPPSVRFTILWGTLTFFFSSLFLSISSVVRLIYCKFPPFPFLTMSGLESSLSYAAPLCSFFPSLFFPQVYSPARSDKVSISLLFFPLAQQSICILPQWQPFSTFLLVELSFYLHL